MKPKSQSTEIKEMKPERAERPRVAASLDSWLACDWSQGVHLPSLDEVPASQRLHPEHALRDHRDQPVR